MEVNAAPATCHRAKFLGVTPRTKEVTLILVILPKMDPVFFCTKKTGFAGNRFFKIAYFDLPYFLKFMINREKHIPHVFSCQSHILTHQMGTPRSGFSVPYRTGLHIPL